MASSAISFLPMNVSLDIWLGIIRLILCGHKYLPCDLLDKIVKDFKKGDLSFAKIQESGQPELNLLIDDLTVREQEVLRSVSEGKPNKVIANEFDISEHTVKLHIHHIIVKLNVHNRTEAAIWYLSQNRNTTKQVIK
ncbi:response regulator transcription factor [Amylibacter sp. SFDW26]|nr:response regulator transcription factor [Amylibacter sp. SFDW26]